jgi:hypothetical protein
LDDPGTGKPVAQGLRRDPWEHELRYREQHHDYQQQAAGKHDRAPFQEQLPDDGEAET